MSKVRKTSGLAWCGVWKDGELGFLAPKFVSAYPSGLSTEQEEMMALKNGQYYPSDLYRVRITIEPVRNKKGRYIVRRNPRNKSEW